MTVDEVLKFKGKDIKEYEKMLDKRQKLMREVRRLSDKIFDEEDSIGVLLESYGELSGEERGRLNRHMETLGDLQCKLEIKKSLLELTNAQIEEVQR